MPSSFMAAMVSNTGCRRALHILLVRLVAEALQIHIGGIQVGLDRLKGLPGHIAVGHEHIGKARLLGQPGRVEAYSK